MNNHELHKAAQALEDTVSPYQLARRLVEAEERMKQYPMQPIAKDKLGRFRFEENPIISHLATCVTDLNRIAVWCAEKDVGQKYQEQLAQLIGYSVDGYGSLSYVGDESYNRAAEAINDQP